MNNKYMFYYIGVGKGGMKGPGPGSFMEVRGAPLGTVPAGPGWSSVQASSPGWAGGPPTGHALMQHGF